MPDAKKILLDSHVFLDYFLGSEKQEKARGYISDINHGRAKGFVSTIAILEVKYRIMKTRGHEKAEEAIFLIKNSYNMKIVDMNHTIAETAADVRFKYYKNKEREMSYADATHIATAITEKCDLIITGDPDFKDIDEIKTEVY